MAAAANSVEASRGSSSKGLKEDAEHHTEPNTYRGVRNLKTQAR